MTRQRTADVRVSQTEVAKFADFYDARAQRARDYGGNRTLAGFRVGPCIAMLSAMRRMPQFIVLMAFMAGASAQAGPITGTTGTPILHVAPPIFVGGLDGLDRGKLTKGSPDMGNVTDMVTGTDGVPIASAGGSISSIPEPFTLLLLGPGVAIALRRRMRQTNQSGGVNAS